MNINWVCYKLLLAFGYRIYITLTIYKGHFADTLLEKRKQLMGDYFHFICNCLACTQNYPLYDQLDKTFDNEEYSSQLNIPLSHEMYTRFDAAMNRVGTNTHTAQKPYIYSEVNKYYNFSEENSTLIKERSTG